MPITYTLQVDELLKRVHPCLQINKKSPCFTIVRSGQDGKSIFHWTREQAVRMYSYHIEGYSSIDFIDEFGDMIDAWRFKEMIKKSHYLKPDNTPSDETIEELWNAVVMEKKIMAEATE